MKVQNSEETNLTKASRVIFPPFVVFVSEDGVGLFLVGVFLLQHWSAFEDLKNNTSITSRVQDALGKVDELISGTRYGAAIVTALLWSVVGVLAYVLAMRLVLFIMYVWRTRYEKENFVFPRWYSGRSLQNDIVLLAVKWVLRQLLALALLLFSLIVVFPTAFSYAQVAVFGTFTLAEALYAILATIFAVRLVAISLCIISKKYSSLYG